MQWRNPNLIKEKKDACIEILDAVVTSKRIGFFRRAVKNELAPKTDLLEKLNNEKKQWGVFNLAEFKKNQPNIIQSSFA